MIIFTKHAVEKMDSLGLERKGMEQIVARGMKWKEEGREGWHANMMGIETVFTKEGGNIVVITVYLAGREK